MNNYEALISKAREVQATVERLGADSGGVWKLLADFADALEEVTRPDWQKDTQPEQGGIPGLTEAEATAYTEALHDPVAAPVEGVREALVLAFSNHADHAALMEPDGISMQEDYDAADALLTEYTITPKETP